MELVNRTPLAADAVVTTGVPEDGPRIGMLVAKATFRFSPDGTVELDTQEPHPLYDEDEETELGLLPGDMLPRRDPAFEVILLGRAHAPGGRPTPSMTVGLSVGRASRSIAVFGDRSWTADGGVSAARPFTTMPLTYERAFGGTGEVFLDAESSLEVQDPVNPLGRGFDVDSRAWQMAEALGAADGYPRVRHDRLLPNLEDPTALIRSRSAVPEPACWATVPMGMGLSSLRVMRELEEHGELRDPRRAEIETYHRAHPQWVVELPTTAARVAMEGLTPDGRVEFDLPELRVIADYVVGERTGLRELRPHALVLLPQEYRFYLVYRAAFTVEVEPGLERSFRLRTEEGWFTPVPPDEPRKRG